MSKQIKMTGFAASEMDMQHEVIECGDEYGALYSQWTGTHVVAFDKEHAVRMGFMANYIANDMDQDIRSGAYDDDPENKRMVQAACRGFWGAGERLIHAFD